MDNNILICNDSMGIGGVETAIYNQIIAMKKKGMNVILIAKKGCYTEKIEKMGIICIEYEFVLEDNFSIDRINYISDLIKKYKITEVHIHKFQCIADVLPACFIQNIPYVAYIHDELNSSYDWYIYYYDIYKTLFPLFFNCAQKIIAIKESVVLYTANRFNIDIEKYKIVNNSIDFDEYKSNVEIDEIKNILLIGRLAYEKEKSIKNAIVFFTKLCDKDNKYNLSILGSGEKEEEIKNFVSKININNRYSINFLGESNDVKKVILKNDVVIGLGRCILEALALKRIPIISGYDTMKGLVCKENILNASKDNFSGFNLDDCVCEELIDKIMNLSKNEILNIINSNYKFAIENLDIQKNLYSVKDCDLNEYMKKNREYITNALIRFQFENKKYKKELNKEKTKVEDLIKKQEILNRQNDEKINNLVLEKNNEINEKERQINEKNSEINEKNSQIIKLNEIVEKKDKEISYKKTELYNVYNSKRWRYTEKISKLLHFGRN